MPDAHLVDLPNRRDRLDVVVGEPVSGAHPKTQFRGGLCPPFQFLEFDRLINRRSGVGIGAGVELHEIGARPDRLLDLDHVWIDEEAHHDSRALQGRDRRGYPLQRTPDIEPSLGGALLPFLRYKRDHVGLHLERYLDHRLHRRHLEVEVARNRSPQQIEIPILDVATVFTQVADDPVGAAHVGQIRGLHRIGLICFPRLTHGCHMIDIHAESSHHYCLPDRWSNRSTVTNSNPSCRAAGTSLRSVCRVFSRG